MATNTPPDIRQRLAKHVRDLLHKHAPDVEQLWLRDGTLSKTALGDAHTEPGAHEPPEVGVVEHMEPGQHETQAPVTPNPSENQDPVGGGTSIPPGQLGDQDTCPLCGQMDRPGACVCLDSIGKAELVPKKTKVVKAPGSGGKPKANPLGKATVPMAKPPSGKVPGPGAAPVASNSSKPALGKAVLPANAKKDMQAQASADSHKAATAPKPAAPAPAKPLTNPNDMSRANNFAAAQGGAFQPSAPVKSGLELGGKPAAPQQPKVTAPPAAMRDRPPAPPAGPPKASVGPVMNAAKPKPPGLMGLFRSETCPFCKKPEHPGLCPEAR
jgi:hypothetical protein